MRAETHTAASRRPCSACAETASAVTARDTGEGPEGTRRPQQNRTKRTVLGRFDEAFRLRQADRATTSYGPTAVVVNAGSVNNDVGNDTSKNWTLGFSGYTSRVRVTV